MTLSTPPTSNRQKKFPLKISTRSRRSGSVVVLVTLSMTTLCGMAALAVDYGMMISTRNQLQRSCDAAALAALSYLPRSKSDAQTAAVFYARQNGNVRVKRSAGDDDDDDDSASAGSVEARDRISFPSDFRVTVPAVRKVGFLFAPLLPGKLTNGNVRARSTAAVQLRDRLNSPAVAPFGITPETYQAGLSSGAAITMRLIEQNKEGLGLNEFVTFDLRSDGNGKSPAQLEDQLKWSTTFNEPTFIGGYEKTLNADDQAQSHAVDDGVETRFNAAGGVSDNGDRYGNIPYGSPRVIYMIVTPSTSGGVNGTNLARVQGFAPVYMEHLSILKAGGTTFVNLRVRMLPPNYDTGIPSSGGGYSDATSESLTSLRISRLVE